MLDRGLSEDGAAQALGWPKQRVTALVKLLELPEQAQQLTGVSWPSSAIDCASPSISSGWSCWRTFRS
jgi:hypothetical protein